MLLAQKHNIVAELSESLSEFYDNLETIFFITAKFNSKSELTEIYPDEIFSNDGLLGMFLYDKQKFVDRFCKEELSKNSSVTIQFKVEPESLTNLKIDIIHNISKEKDYKKLLKFLISLIILNENLNKSGDIRLDQNFNEFFKNFSNHYVIN
jgi:hypothetical protein